MLKINLTLTLTTGWNDVRTLAGLTITNDTTGTPERGNYDVLLQTHDSTPVARAGRVEGYDRTEPAWCLLADALSPMVARYRLVRRLVAEGMSEGEAQRVAHGGGSDA